MVSFLYFMQVGTLVFTRFDFTKDMQWHTIISLTIAIIYTIILVPVFALITGSIVSEQMEEAKMSFYQKDYFKRMFDSLPEGIIVMKNGKISFMNDLSN